MEAPAPPDTVDLFRQFPPVIIIHDCIQFQLQIKVIDFIAISSFEGMLTFTFFLPEFKLR